MPFVQLITDLATVPEAVLLERLRSSAPLPLEARNRLSVQLRDPQLSVRELLRLGRALRAATREVGASLIVNDRVDVALLLGADGVHLGRRSMSPEDARALLGPEAWVSMSAHSVEEALSAAKAGANAVLLSPIFESPGKGPPLGPEALGKARALVHEQGLALQIYALGGVTGENAAACFDAGAHGVAAIRADLGWWTMDHPPRTT